MTQVEEMQENVSDRSTADIDQDLRDHFDGAYFIQDLEALSNASAAGACLHPLLVALDWTGEARHLHEALPHFDTVDDINGLRAVLARLNYVTRAQKLKLDALRPDMLPCLFLPADEIDGKIYVVLCIEDNGCLVIFDGMEKMFRQIDADSTKGTAFRIRRDDGQQSQSEALKFGWIQSLLLKFKRTFVLLFGLTFVINILALTVPIYIMNVYDKAIGAKSLMTLGFLLSGILIALASEYVLRGLRSRAIAYLGTRVESLLTIGAFQQILYLPISMTEAAPIGAQVTRLKQFESVRGVFTGQLFGALLDMPFLIVFLSATFLLGGLLGWIPTALIVLYVVMGCVTIPLTNHFVARAGEARSQSRNFLIELTTKYRGVRDNSAEDIWTERYGHITSKLLQSQFSAQQTGIITQTLSQAFVLISGAATVGLGTLFVLQGTLTIGALIAVMALVWRILSPLQSAFLSLNRLSQVTQSFKQINSLMRLKPERHPGQLPSFYREFKGEFLVQGVSFRHNPRSEPALRGVNLRVEPGEIIAITGPSGAGKTTLLNVLARVYQTQSGAVILDNLDLRQIDPAELRHAIGYVPQRPAFFYGTIEQNIKFAHPTASREDIIRALRDSGALAAVERLENGIETRLHKQNFQEFSIGFLQQLMLARAYVKNASIYFLDEAGSNLDDKGEELFMHKLSKLRGRSTVFMVTHRPSHMRVADRVIVLVQGAVAAEGPPDKIVDAILTANRKTA